MFRTSPKKNTFEVLSCCQSPVDGQVVNKTAYCWPALKTAQHTSHEPQGKDKELISRHARLVGDPGRVQGIAAYTVQPGEK